MTAKAVFNAVVEVVAAFRYIALRTSYVIINQELLKLLYFVQDARDRGHLFKIHGKGFFEGNVTVFLDVPSFFSTSTVSIVLAE